MLQSLEQLQGSMQWLACQSCVNRTANLGHSHPTFTQRMQHKRNIYNSDKYIQQRIELPDVRSAQKAIKGEELDSTRVC